MAIVGIVRMDDFGLRRGFLRQLYASLMHVTTCRTIILKIFKLDTKLISYFIDKI